MKKMSRVTFYALLLCLMDRISARVIADGRTKDLRVFKPLMVPGFPENTTAVVGGQAKLVCKVHRPLSTKVQWLKKEDSVSGQTLEGPPRPRELTALQSNASKVYTLHLHNVTTEDAGEYICMAKNPTGQAMQSAWLEVLPVTACFQYKGPG
ncbi:hypothetical protein fugu_008609 [Takifugu bimaculatus]|uniref:receptor protein-tyrosine kinase n=1 Tax=Takifugu bimaculatus TaxID=433685 RepID=A0A4Z2AWB6_9TELE|nr:hypothetical protein fugu_008609 [Takifugu bimaculatus]